MKGGRRGTPGRREVDDLFQQCMLYGETAPHAQL